MAGRGSATAACCSPSSFAMAAPSGSARICRERCACRSSWSYPAGPYSSATEFLQRSRNVSLARAVAAREKVCAVLRGALEVPAEIVHGRQPGALHELAVLRARIQLLAVRAPAIRVTLVRPERAGIRRQLRRGRVR